MLQLQCLGVGTEPVFPDQSCQVLLSPGLGTGSGAQAQVNGQQASSSSFFFFFWSFCLSRAAPAAFGGFQARGSIRAIAAGLPHSHSKWDQSRICDLYHSSWQCLILNPLSEAGDQTGVLMDASRVC